MKNDFQYLDHTADEGIKIVADSPQKIFVLAAEGMLNLIYDFSSIVPKDSRQVIAEAPSRDLLLVEWLSEIKALLDFDSFLPAEIKITQLTENQVKGSVEGKVFNPEEHEIFGEVKAVTYHQLTFEQIEENLFQAKIIFDT